MASRNYDILIWGASGFTGSHLVEYLALNAPSGTRIAIGGRNHDKIEQVRSRIAAKCPGAVDALNAMDILVGNSQSAEDMRFVASQTRVVASTVGPYSIYGEQLIRACVEEGTDYCDITAEVPWIQKLNRELNEKAQAKNVHIVSMCGFDCIPADLGCLMLAKYAKKQFDEPLLHVKGSIVGIIGGVSGGTLATLANELSVQAKRVVKHMCAKITGGASGSLPATNGKETNRWVVHYDKTLGRWQTFWVMSTINAMATKWAGRVLQYGPAFSYAESMTSRNWLQAVGQGLGFLYVGLFMFFSLSRNLLYALRIIPRPGQGPSDEFMKKGYFSLHLEAFSQNKVFYGKVSGSSDPGYSETIKYLGESALCLAYDRDSSFRPGIYPPSVAMGSRLLERLREKGCQFDVGMKQIPAIHNGSHKKTA
ncbi:Saccharopine dehydrogenase-domain-containing protein [Coemansia mojavensis]|nr:Saccharopine dehydrogenase-domain-containing protein [Coemansia mojavensis]